MVTLAYVTPEICRGSEAADVFIAVVFIAVVFIVDVTTVEQFTLLVIDETAVSVATVKEDNVLVYACRPAVLI